MGDAPTQAEVKVGALPELSPEEKAKAEAFRDQVLQPMIAEAVAKAVGDAKKDIVDKTVDISTRPTFEGPAATTKTGVDIKTLVKALKVERDERGRIKSMSGGYAPARPVFDDVKMPEEEEAALAERVAPYINKFPLGDLDNFRIERWQMALDHAHFGIEGSGAFMKFAPWETRFYDAWGAVSKAQGEMVSGQDGGYLAPEFWATKFVDQLYSAQVLSDFPITSIPMPGRLEHFPKLTGAVTVSYGSESASLTASAAQFAQLTSVPRKQYIFVQISNELIRDSNPAAVQVILNNAVRYAALDRDKQTLLGNGQSGAPAGLLNVTNFATNGTFATGQAPLYTELVTGIHQVETINDVASTIAPIGQATCTGVFGPVALKKELLSMKDSNNRAILEYGVNQLRGVKGSVGGGYFDGLLGVDTWRFSNVLQEAAGSRHVIFGDWQHLWVLLRQDVEIMTSNVAGTAFQNDQTWLRLIARWDVICVHPEAFYAFSNG